MGLNKFITKKGRVLLDLTEDTVTPETLGKGVTAHDRSGEPILGTMESGGGGGGINIVDELPEVGVEGAFYGVTALTDMVMVYGTDGFYISMAEGGTMNAVMATTETFPTIEPFEGLYCYVTDIPDVYCYAEGVWNSFSELGMAFLGEIGDIGEADTLKSGVYAVIGTRLYKCTNGQFKEFVTRGGLKYETNGDGTCKVIGLEPNYSFDIIIPSISPDGDTVTEIGGGSGTDGLDKTLIKSVTIPDTIEKVGEYAFRDCVALETINFPNKFISFGNYTFAECYSLGSVTLGDGMRALVGRMFQNCINLTEINLPSTMTQFSGEALDGCIKLTKITFGGTMEQWNSINKTTGWNGSVPATKVICTDGEVAL